MTRVPRSRNRARDQVAQQARAWAVALNVVYGTIAFALIGFAIDYFTGSTPWGVLIGALVGLIVGTYRFIREAMALSRSYPPARQEPGQPDSKNTP